MGYCTDLIKAEGESLAKTSRLYSGNVKQARETLERIVDAALSELYAYERECNPKIDGSTL